MLFQGSCDLFRLEGKGYTERYWNGQLAVNKPLHYDHKEFGRHRLLLRATVCLSPVITAGL